MWIENAKYGIKMTEEADEFKSTKILNYYNIDFVASQTIRKFQDQGYQTTPRDD
jgi:hypothetical protein